MSSLTGNEYQQIYFLLQPQVLPLCFNGVGVTVFLRFLSAVMSFFCFPFFFFFLFFSFSSFFPFFSFFLLFFFSYVLFMYSMFFRAFKTRLDANKNVLD